MSVTLTITDASDGTGGQAVISGSAGGSANVLYYASFTGLMQSYAMASYGSRVGDGAIAIAVATGDYLWQVVSNGTDLSGVVHQNITDAGTRSTHDRIIEAVLTRLALLSLLPTTKLLFKWIPRIYESIDTAPCIYVCPVGSELYVSALTSSDDVSYPVYFILVDKQNQDSVKNREKILLWRQRIMKLFRFQRLPGVQEVINAEVDPDSIVDPVSFKNNYLVSLFMIRFVSRERRGLT